MAFEKDHKRIEGSGRALGTKNKNTAIRDWIRSFTLEYLESETGFRADFSALKPSERTGLIEKMLKYTVPSMTSVQFQDDSETTSAREYLKGIISYEDKSKH